MYMYNNKYIKPLTQGVFIHVHVYCTCTMGFEPQLWTDLVLLCHSTSVHHTIHVLLLLCCQLPEPSALELLKQGLLLVYVWNKTLPHPIIPVAG